MCNCDFLADNPTRSRRERASTSIIPLNFFQNLKEIHQKFHPRVTQLSTYAVWKPGAPQDTKNTNEDRNDPNDPNKNRSKPILVCLYSSHMEITCATSSRTVVIVLKSKKKQIEMLSEHLYFKQKNGIKRTTNPYSHDLGSTVLFTAVLEDKNRTTFEAAIGSAATIIDPSHFRNGTEGRGCSHCIQTRSSTTLWNACGEPEWLTDHGRMYAYCYNGN